MQRGWWAALLVAIALVPALILLLFNGSNESANALHVRTDPVVVGELDPVSASNVVGSPIEIFVRVTADRPIPIDRLVVQMTDQHGSSVQLTPESGRAPAKIGAADPIAVPMSGSVSEAGIYTYELRYLSQGVWHDLPPYGTLVIGR